MKKSKRFLCMLIAAVMLLGAFPAHAASAPPAATYKAAAPTRLPDGTTGATVGMIGRTTANQYGDKEAYGCVVDMNNISTIQKTGYLFQQINLTSDKAKANHTVYIRFAPWGHRLADFAGAKLPAGYLFDVYNQADNSFICQYDTRGDTQDFTIPCAPGDNPNNPKPKKAPAPVKTQFNDVQPGSKYYDAVTAVAKGRLLLGIFDEDPNGNLKVNEPVSGVELSQIGKRLAGTNTEEYVWTHAPCRQAPTCIWTQAVDNDDVYTNPSAYDHRFCTHGASYDYNPSNTDPAKCTWKDGCGPGVTRLTLMGWVGSHAKLYNAITPEQAQLNAARLAADADFIHAYADWEAKYRMGGLMTNDYKARYDDFKTKLLPAWNAAYTDGATEAQLADGSYLLQPMTRGDVCLLLYRLGITQFGCCAIK